MVTALGNNYIHSAFHHEQTYTTQKTTFDPVETSAGKSPDSFSPTRTSRKEEEEKKEMISVDEILAM